MANNPHPNNKSAVVNVSVHGIINPSAINSATHVTAMSLQEWHDHMGRPPDNKPGHRPNSLLFGRGKVVKDNQRPYTYIKKVKIWILKVVQYRAKSTREGVMLILKKMYNTKLWYSFNPGDFGYYPSLMLNMGDSRNLAPPWIGYFLAMKQSSLFYSHGSQNVEPSLKVLNFPEAIISPTLATGIMTLDMTRQRSRHLGNPLC